MIKKIMDNQGRNIKGIKDWKITRFGSHNGRVCSFDIYRRAFIGAGAYIAANGTNNVPTHI